MPPAFGIYCSGVTVTVIGAADAGKGAILIFNEAAEPKESRQLLLGMLDGLLEIDVEEYQIDVEQTELVAFQSAHRLAV